MTDSKLDHIKQVPLFDGLSAGELRRLAALTDEVDVPAGSTLTREGAFGHEFIVLVDGAASVRQDGREIRTLQGGDFLGELALVNDIRRTATVTTTEPSKALVLTAAAFRELMRSPAIEAKVSEAAAVRS